MAKQNQSNHNLVPIFINSEYSSILIIGHHFNKALETVLTNFSSNNILILSTQENILDGLLQKHPNISIENRLPQKSDFEKSSMVFVCGIDDGVDDIKTWATETNSLIHFSEQPELSNFSLGNLIDKGHLSIGLLAEDVSPGTMHKITNAIDEIIPNEIDELLDNLSVIGKSGRKALRKKVSVINKFTKEISKHEEYVDPFSQLENTSRAAKSAQNKANVYLGIVGFLVCIVLFFITIYEFNLYPDVKSFLGQDNHIFYWMVLVGFLAEIIAGSMGMGYGVICTTILLLLNVPPPVVSASIHSAESFTSAAGSISHYKLGNVNMKLVKSLAPFAIGGAIVGAVLLTYLGEHYAHIVKPIISLYTLYIGLNILIKTTRKKKVHRSNRKKSNLKVLGSVGGFIDSFAGGGWGPLVTGSLIKDGRTPRFVVGSSTFAKFLLTITSAVTFVLTIGVHHWNIILGLLLGGIITAPFSALLTAKLPVKKMTIFISILVIVMSSISIYKSLFL